MLARARIRPLFIRYAAPGVVAMLFLAFQSIVDGLIVGRLIGANALAAVNIVAPTYTLASAIVLIIGLGTQETLLPLAVDYIYGVMPWLAGVGGLFFFDYTLKALAFIVSLALLRREFQRSRKVKQDTRMEGLKNNIL